MAEEGVRVLLIQALKEEEEVDDQSLPAPITSDLDLGHLTENQQAQVKALIKLDVL